MSVVLVIVLAIVLISMLLVVLRLVLGPHALDRLVAFESFAILFVALAALLGVFYRSAWFLDAILVISLVGFLSTVGIALRQFSEGDS